MRKLLILLLIVAVAFAAGWVADNAGEFSLDWLGWKVEGSVAFLLIALMVASALIWLVLHWLNALLKVPSEIRKERERLLASKGLEQLTQAMLASSENDEKTAQKHLKKARGYLPDSPLPRLMQLQIAGREKDTQLAGQQLVQLQHYSATKPLALRGLAEQARAAGKMDEALVHIDALLEVAPQQATTQKLAIDILSYHKRWAQALKIAKQAYAARYLTVDEYKRAKATIGMQQAASMLADKNRQGAMETLKKAFATDATLQPVAIEYSRLLKQVGKVSQAAKVLKSAWKHAPHAKIAETYQELYADLSPERQCKKIQELAKQNSDHLESQIILAECAMTLEKWDEAKNYLKLGINKQNTVTLCRLMAKLYKRGYKDESEERRWLDKAITAVEDAHWQCATCGDKPESWVAHCEQCHDFASINWRPDKPLSA